MGVDKTLDQKTQGSFDTLANTGTWPSRYSEMNYVNYNFITRREAVRRLLQPDRFSTVLDIGCGTGNYYEMLAHFSDKYVGVDFSSVMINQARARYAKDPGRPLFLVGSSETIPFPDNEFDLVNAIGFIEYFADPSIPLAEIARVLKPGGTLIIQSYQIDFFKRVSIVFGVEAAKDMIRGLVRILFKKDMGMFSVDRPYTKEALDKLVSGHDFEIESYCYNNFHMLPRLARRLFPGLYIRLSDNITKLNEDRYKIFAVNYIGRYILHKEESA